MSTTDLSFSTTGENAATAPVPFLERQQRVIESLQHQLQSYHYVPRTVGLYEQMENLKEALRNLRKENDQLLEGVHQMMNNRGELKEACQRQLEKILEVERQILDYIGRAKFHC